MATAVKNTITGQRVSTLDVLWAFYQSQPKKIKIAFRNMLETQDNTKKQNKLSQWQIDLKEIRSLKAGWDEGAPQINKIAIANVNKFAESLSQSVAEQIRLYPTQLGAVMLKLETPKGRIKCEIGDVKMSYFVKRQGFETEHHSFEDINDETLSTLNIKLESII
ncbi:MAG: hypothetical protein II075_07765 [Bacteroidales bacterium]|nr:hypothetical protein [Bacteroidales bacterium]